MISDEEVSQWEEETINLYESEPYQYSFTKYIYWKLEQLSCILVLRNRDWFKNNIGQLEKVWKIVEEERVSGFQHRAPKISLSKKQPQSQPPIKLEPNLLTYLSILKK